jgi:hypothetical protein
VSLFRKKKVETEMVPVDIDPREDKGMVGLYYRLTTEAEEDFANAVMSHLARLHEPGGYEREKQEHDFMALGMKSDYLDALDDIEFKVEDVVSAPVLQMKKRGMASLATRWTARGVHNRPLAGMPPTGETVIVEGMTYTSFRNYNIRVEYTYWQIPEMTRRMVER